MAKGQRYTAIDTRDDSVYRYGFGASSETTMQLLDVEQSTDYNTNNNTFDGRSRAEDGPVQRTRSRSRMMIMSPENPQVNTQEMYGMGNNELRSSTNGHSMSQNTGTDYNFANTRDNNNNTNNRTSFDDASELMATTTVADELARVVWDLSAAAEMHPQQTTENDLLLLQQMAHDAKDLQKQLQSQLASYSGENETVFASALVSNDAIQNVLSSYDDIIMRVTSAREYMLASGNSGASGNTVNSHFPSSIDASNMSEEEIVRRLYAQEQERAAPSTPATPPPPSVAELPDLMSMDSMERPLGRTFVTPTNVDTTTGSSLQTSQSPPFIVQGHSINRPYSNHEQSASAPAVQQLQQQQQPSNLPSLI